MSPTRSLVLYSSMSTVTALAVYALLRVLGLGVQTASCWTCGYAAGIFLTVAVIYRVIEGSFTTPASAGIVGAGATMVCALMAASRSANMFGLLLAGLVLGIAVSLFALLKDLDERTSPKLLLAVPAIQLFLLLTALGR